MKVIINTINIYHIHDNSYHIDNKHNGNARHSGVKASEETNTKFVPHVVLNGDDLNNPLVLELQARILQSENEIKELLNKLDNEKT